MVAWCSVRGEGFASQAERDQTLSELLALQLEDGGWSTSSLLTDWKVRSDGEPLETKISDGYGTGFVIVVSRELGLAADDRRLERGVAWILTHQRESGKWFTRSPVRDCGNRISNAGSAFAVLALQACGELPGWPLGKGERR
jgi:squalene-hopene/tetraprenyl-beta-curcumene cyclase